MYETLRLERRGAVDWLYLNRPDRLNALSVKMVEELHGYFDAIRYDLTRRVVVMQGTGRAFCSGFDMKEGMPEVSNPTTVMMRQRLFTEMIHKMRDCPQPVVALVRGAACGGGLSLALGADIRLVGQSAKMNAAYIRLGFTGTDMGSSYFMPRYVGLSVASELLMTGRFVDADRAIRIGLASEVHPDDELDAAGEAIVGEMLQTSPLGLMLTKEALNVNVDAPNIRAAAAVEDRNQVLCSTDPQVQRKIGAFVGRDGGG